MRLGAFELWSNGRHPLNRRRFIKDCVKVEDALGRVRLYKHVSQGIDIYKIDIWSS